MATGKRLVLVVTLISLSGMLAACDSFDPDTFDPLGINAKKKLPGERKDLFPSGVPGVQQGIPPEYMKGYQAPPDNTPVTATDENSDEKKAAAEEEKPKTKPKPKPKVVRRTPPPAAAQPAGQAQPGQQPAPAWPNQQQKQQQSQQSESSSPQPPQPGTFSR